MKKIQIIIAVAGLLLVLSPLTNNAQQLLGKWVVPTKTIASGDQTFCLELNFYPDDIVNVKLTQSLLNYSEGNSFISGGAYNNNNYNRDFYVINNIIYDGDEYFSNYFWLGYQINLPEFQIIQKPDINNE